jgi:hypothetical protein
MLVMKSVRTRVSLPLFNPPVVLAHSLSLVQVLALNMSLASTIFPSDHAHHHGRRQQTPPHSLRLQYHLPTLGFRTYHCG